MTKGQYQLLLGLLAVVLIGSSALVIHQKIKPIVPSTTTTTTSSTTTTTSLSSTTTSSTSTTTISPEITSSTTSSISSTTSSTTSTTLPNQTTTSTTSSTSTTSTTLVQTCYGENNVFNLLDDPNATCCPGLTQIGYTFLTVDGCNAPQCPCYICTKCGNGICETGENLCNCPEDCS